MALNITHRPLCLGFFSLESGYLARKGGRFGIRDASTQMEVVLNHLICSAQSSRGKASFEKPRPAGLICEHAAEAFPQSPVTGGTGIKWLIVSFEKPCPRAMSITNQKIKSSPGRRRISNPWGRRRLAPPLLAANADVPSASLSLGQTRRAVRTVLFYIL